MTLKGYERMTFVLGNLVYHADIGMAEGRSGLRPALETGQSLLVVRQFFRQKLQSSKTMQRRVPGLVTRYPSLHRPAFSMTW